jgi:hypothetical protein
VSVLHALLEDIAHKKVYISQTAFVIQVITVFKELSLQRLQTESQEKNAQLGDTVVSDHNLSKYVHLELTILVPKNLLKPIVFPVPQENIVQE